MVAWFPQQEPSTYTLGDVWCLGFNLPRQYKHQTEASFIMSEISNPLDAPER